MMVKALADASELAWQGIVSMNSASVGKGLSDTMKAWEAMLPYTVDPYLHIDAAKSKQLRDFWTPYDVGGAEGCLGCLFSGAGGGFLFIMSDKPVKVRERKSSSSSNTNTLSLLCGLGSPPTRDMGWLLACPLAAPPPLPPPLALSANAEGCGGTTTCYA